MTATFGFTVEVTIVALAVVIALAFVVLVLILRTPRSHRIRVGFFVERDTGDTPALPDDDTDEWPMQPS